MKVRFLQIATSEFGLYALDDLGRIWKRSGGEWIKIENPVETEVETPVEKFFSK